MLEGKSVVLRALEPADLERAYKWMNDPEVRRYVAMRYPVARVDEQAWLRDRPPNSFAGGVRLAIDTKEGVHIGNLDLREVRPEDRSASLGIVIGEKEYWSNGHGTDALTTLLRFAFYEMNLHRVSLHTFEFNERGQACYRKCGFVEEGRLREHYYAEGRYWDCLVMAVLREEFEALHGVATEAVGSAT